MKKFICLVLLLTLAGCSDTTSSPPQESAKPRPAVVDAVWHDITAWVDEFNEDFASEDEYPAQLSVELISSDRGYKLAFYLDMKIDNLTSGGQVIYREEHTRKRDAWFIARIMILPFLIKKGHGEYEKWIEQVHQCGEFYEIAWHYTINEVEVSASIPLPLKDDPIAIKLHDPLDGKTYTWPDTGNVPATGPDHFCFKLFDCEACEKNAILYSPFASN